MDRQVQASHGLDGCHLLLIQSPESVSWATFLSCGALPPAISPHSSCGIDGSFSSIKVAFMLSNPPSLGSDQCN